MEINTPYSKTKKTIKGLKRTQYKEYDKYGKLVMNHYVEFEVIGKNRTWPEFMPAADFEELNPGVEV